MNRITCSWHQKTKPRIHQFTNLKCCKISFIAFKMKKQGLKCFFKVINKKPLKRGFIKALWLLCSTLSKFVNWWIRGFVFWCHEQVIIFLFVLAAGVSRRRQALIENTRSCCCISLLTCTADSHYQSALILPSIQANTISINFLYVSKYDRKTLRSISNCE